MHGGGALPRRCDGSAKETEGNRQCQKTRASQILAHSKKYCVCCLAIPLLVSALVGDRPKAGDPSLRGQPIGSSSIVMVRWPHVFEHRARFHLFPSHGPASVEKVRRAALPVFAAGRDCDLDGQPCGLMGVVPGGAKAPEYGPAFVPAIHI